MESQRRDVKHYEVRYTDVVERSDMKLGPRTWVRNCEAHVATTSVERAIELVKENVPEAVIVSVQCRNAHMALIVDDRVNPQPHEAQTGRQGSEGL